ncbi:isocitrate/isopropylmalate dehydrogenase family protein [Candidatus Fermentibacteria bacterium]|nr:isocitrate/isopropylmalate dehydrogenase family protein [Candidatus Fermentibacteria bacterium]
MARTVVTMPGDGVGADVLKEALKVLEAVGFEADYVHADIGWEFWKKEGNPLPQRTLDLIEEHKVALFGAITSKPKDKAAEELAPALRGKGFVYYSPIVGLRQHFDLYVCCRPCRAFKGNPLNFVRRGPEGKMEEPPIDVVIFRQNTEGLYSGVEWTNPPEHVYKALNAHPKFEKFTRCAPEDLAVSTRIFTREACHKILKAGFEHAKRFGYRSVTICEKPNVIRETSGMMREEGRKLASQYDGIELWETNIDAQMMWMTKNPEDYGVIVSGNMFGDIVSDGFAGLVGGLGFANSANIGDRVAVFEPTHGSAPKYASYDVSIINPLAMILSSCSMLEHVGEVDKARKVRKAIELVISEGKVRTYDMLKMKGSPDVIEKGAASTARMGDAVCEALERVD